MISSDAVVHELYEGDELRDAVVEQIRARGGARRGRRQRGARAAGVRDRGGPRLARELVWPIVGARVAAWLTQARAADPAPPAAVVEVPLLFEAGLEGIYDATIAVISDERLRASAPAPAATRRSTSAPRASSRQQEKAPARRTSCATTAPRPISSASCRRFLSSWEHDQGTPRHIRRARLVLVCAALLAVVLSRPHTPRPAARATPRSSARRPADKHLDPALIAAVIYAESKFEPRRHRPGAQGLMQILPATAYYLAQLSGGHAFTASDLATPERQRRLRQLLPALPARPLPRQRDARRRRLQRRSGERRPLGRAGPRGGGSSRSRKSRSRRRANTSSGCSGRSRHTARTTPSSWGSTSGRRRGAGAPAGAAGLATVGGRRDARVRTRRHLQPDRRSAGGDRVARRGDPRGRALPDAARRDRHRQDDDDGRRRSRRCRSRRS